MYNLNQDKCINRLTDNIIIIFSALFETAENKNPRTLTGVLRTHTYKLVLFSYELMKLLQ